MFQFIFIFKFNNIFILIIIYGNLKNKNVYFIIR